MRWERIKIYNAKEREKISIEELNKMIRITTKGRVQSYINDNDKEPMWDGNIYGYSKIGSDSNKDWLFRMPVQVKSKMVKKFDNKFVSYPIETVCLQSYFNDRGIIYFVVEIKDNDDGNYETKIFYKILTPSILKNILDETKESQETKKVQINKILDEKLDFFVVCKQFDKIRKIEGIEALNQVIPIEKVLGKEINIETISGINDVLYGDYCSYYTDENNVKIPIRLPGKFVEYSRLINRSISLGDKTYFTNWEEHKNNNEETFITFGDTIKIKDNKFSIIKSKDNILERHKTIEFFLNIISEEKITKEDLESIEVLKNEKELIEKVFKICDRFDIKRESLKLKDFKGSDVRVVDILSEVKDDNIDLNNIREVKCEIVIFLNYRIALLKVIYNDGNTIYHNFYSDKIKLCIGFKYKNKELYMSRFITLDEIPLNTHNFNEKLVLESLSPIKKENYEVEADLYNNLMLNLIKAWDKNNRNEYINLINYLESELKEYISEEIYLINKAQLEYRLNNKLSHKTIENLYRIKFNGNINNHIKCAICILLKDYEGFEELLFKLSNKEQEFFKNYPIYSLYEDRNVNTIINY